MFAHPPGLNIKSALAVALQITVLPNYWRWYMSAVCTVQGQRWPVMGIYGLCNHNACGGPSRRTSRTVGPVYRHKSDGNSPSMMHTLIVKWLRSWYFASKKRASGWSRQLWCAHSGNFESNVTASITYVCEWQGNDAVAEFLKQHSALW